MPFVLEPLTAEAFAPFGEVIAATESAHSFAINGGTTERFHDLAAVEVDGEARGGISIFRGQAREFPIAIRMLERHPKGSQAFMPLQGRPYLVVVAPNGANDVPNLSQIRLFYATAEQGVNYRSGTWHHPLLALQATSDFLVVDRIGEGHNCDEFFFSDEQVMTIEQNLLVECDGLE
ncbi:ureidoglycolate lyase [Marinomonas spartinae]|uniref:ureidoglycolate lyase n=1 Tax=Marinomonas spartinae TaxID=1792290 RepID=UPI0018F1BDBA|nr:ureidoglycolate lyase [Marinomonas spartinae]MBJ7553343.1 ureidoglycolate lyase [Marinomonas spartinae]